MFDRIEIKLLEFQDTQVSIISNVLFAGRIYVIHAMMTCISEFIKQYPMFNSVFSSDYNFTQIDWRYLLTSHDCFSSLLHELTIYMECCFRDCILKPLVKGISKWAKKLSGNIPKPVIEENKVI